MRDTALVLRDNRCSSVCQMFLDNIIDREYWDTLKTGYCTGIGLKKQNRIVMLNEYVIQYVDLSRHMSQYAICLWAIVISITPSERLSQSKFTTVCISNLSCPSLNGFDIILLRGCLVSN